MNVLLLYASAFRVSQSLSYVIPPDPSLRSSPSPISLDLPHDPPPSPSWRKQRFPPILVKGFAFGRDFVEVECKVSNRY